ncbi:hypothetical protein GCM10017576_23350 [Microbacterium barkeri]|uniref:Uncharacterized protein n=1 Tax=Microbacterium barkeri TaxID=33917 RepID=A0A9W6H465_9MICO|nr:hypothetical protein [Microbacterium barkeri]MDI6944192.1 hypothetical protein [Microbacterium barkeri]MDR6876764.1 hypothetical protein [Microbacterium barkeri]GLJ62205.1 hypothetical protein GCM10017576_23350 [Microbacterium barkeri]
MTTAATDEEIIEFFEENFGLPEVEQNIDGCWHALLCEITVPLEDPDILMGGFRAEPADTERAHCDHTCDCAYFKKVPRAAELFGLTAAQIADGDYELAPRFADQLHD